MTDSWGFEIEMKGMDPSGMLELHKATRKALTHTINDQGRVRVFQVKIS